MANFMIFMAIMVATATMQFHCTAAQTRHLVGGALGWTVPPGGASNYTSWASVQNFTVGDLLVFNFTGGIHDVAEVSAAAFEPCTATNPISLTTTTPATLTLTTAGAHYYICTFPSHCQIGQKLSINVSAATTAIPPSMAPASPPPTAATPPSMAPASPPTTTATPPSMAPASPPPTATTPPSMAPAPASPPTTTATPPPTAATPPSTTPVPSPSTTPSPTSSPTSSPPLPPTTATTPPGSNLSPTGSTIPPPPPPTNGAPSFTAVAPVTFLAIALAFLN